MISLLIVSDIHASDKNLGKDDAVSWFSTLPEYKNSPRTNPFVGIPQLLKQENLTVNYLLCPGDLADRAQPAAQTAAWDRLEELKHNTGAQQLIGTVGNHDIDSRLAFSDFDPKTTLQSLTPAFPGLAEADCDFFWSRNFVIRVDGDVRFLILNSCAFHGIHSGEARNSHTEYLHGRVSARTIDAILSKLEGVTPKLNVLLLHHHIVKNEHITEKDYSEMKNGSALIRGLVDSASGPWLIVHGHQHYPDLFYAPGTAGSPVVLSAGSMSRRLDGALAQRALNQIYHIELPIEQFGSLGCYPCGIVRSWHWTHNVGWNKTGFERPENTSVPYRAGFGCRKHPDWWVDEINQRLSSAESDYLYWNDLLGNLPELRYVLPADLRAVLKKLRDLYSIKVVAEDGYPCQIGRK